MLDDFLILIIWLMLVFGKKSVELLEVFFIEVFVVFVKDIEFEVDVVLVELVFVFEILGYVLVDIVRRLELCFFIKLVFLDLVVFCFIEVMGKVFWVFVCIGLDKGIDGEIVF